MKFARTVSIISLGFAATACGGGGGSSPAAPPTPPAVVNTAEGIWIGTAGTGNTAAVAILENGETWGLYSSGTTIIGALNGTVTGAGSAVSGSGSDYNLVSHTVSSGTLNGNVSAKSAINITTSTGGTFNGSYRTFYDQPASLAALAGTYTGYGVSGSSSTQSFPLTINASGAISAGSAAQGCTASGAATTRSSGKNIFNLSVTFTGTNCALGNGASTTGIAILDATVSPTRLYALALKADKSDGFIYTGTK